MRTRLPRDPASASRARHFVIDAFRTWAIPQDVADVRALLVSELAGNAGRHGRGELDVAVQLWAQTVRVIVHDGSPTLPTHRQVQVEAEGGRGMWLVDALAGSWGAELHPGHGKDVWFELSRL